MKATFGEIDRKLMTRQSLILFFFLGVVTAAHAAEPLDSLFEEFRRRDMQEDELRREREKAPDVRLQESVPEISTDLPKDTVCFTIDRIELDGLPEYFSWAQTLVDRYLGLCIGREGINRLLRLLQREFLARGFVTTRVYLPPQELVTATLRFTVVPGKVKTVRFADDDPSGTWTTAFPLRSGDLLNLRDLEQGLEQMKRLPSQDIEMEIVELKSNLVYAPEAR
jgi:hemolysin activation/secretion protein